MTDTDTALRTTNQNDDDDISVWARKLELISFKDNPWRWNKEWEKALHSLSSSKDVYPVMSQFYSKDLWNSTDFSQHCEHLKGRVCEVQNIVVKLWDNVQEGERFVTAWFLLDEGERKRHLLKGMEEACQRAPLSQDSRALCPEVTISSMASQRGRAFVDFISAYSQGKKDVGENSTYSHPSDWWEKAADEIPQSLSDELQEHTFTLLTLHRNDFICELMMLMLDADISDLLSQLGSCSMPECRFCTICHMVAPV